MSEKSKQWIKANRRNVLMSLMSSDIPGMSGEDLAAMLDAYAAEATASLQAELEQAQREIERLERERNEAQGEAKRQLTEYGVLQRTVKHMEDSYLREHGGSWGKCKYQSQVELAESQLAEARRENGELSSRLERLQQDVRKADAIAGGRWPEWGERACMVADALEDALNRSLDSALQSAGAKPANKGS